MKPTAQPATVPTQPGGGDEPRRRLQELVSVALRNSVAALDDFTDRLGTALTAASLQAEDSSGAEGLRLAAEHLSRERASFQRLFTDCLQQGFEQEAALLLARPKSRLRKDALDLSLDSFEAMQRKVVIDNLAQAFDREHAAQLTALHARLALWLESEPAGMRNPFRAEVFLRAAMSAWERFEPYPAARGVLQQLLSPGVFLSLDAILDAVEQELRARTGPGAPERRYRRRDQRIVPGTTLLHTERRAMTRAGAVLDSAFDHLVRSGDLPAHTLAMLECLRPALRALAEEDGRFLIGPRHPGRRLVQTLIQTSLAAGNSTTQGAALQALVERLAHQLMQQRDAAQLEAAAKQVEALLLPLLQSVAGKRDDCIEEAMRQEKEARAEQLARSEVMKRLEDGQVPSFVESFLLEHWARVLAFAQNVHATKPALLPNLIQAMDDLIWSVQHKHSARERREVEERLPALLALLHAWLNVVKWEGPLRQDFFEKLAERHRVVMQGQPPVDPRTALEERMDIVQRASEHELTRRAEEQQDDALVPYMHRIDALVPGDWVEFVRNDGSSVHCRLAWVSAARSRFVFVAPAIDMAFVIEEHLFAQGLRARRSRIAATGEVLQAALTLAAAEVAAR